ncbi:hypothetical protein [Bartonella sp. B1099]|uniref:DUF7146 domain-containing protein n=1 Tax=Bartonella sp. B1099 TaxID=2911422 RepID=UPI0020C3450F|nr:hypothetical protein [Bartonella sp. B1099]
MFSFTNVQGITRALHGVWYGCYGLARCPAHDDQLPSLSITNGNDGRLLLTCYAGCSFREIIQALRRIGLLGKQAFFDKAYDHTLSFSKQFCTDFKRAKQKAERAKKIWQQSQPIKNTLAETYLRMRGLTCELPADLRFHDKCPHPLGMKLPALVALVKGAGSFAIHRTFLKANGCKTDQKPADDAGRKADFTLAKRAYSQGFEVFIMQAPKGTDFNDFLYHSRYVI